MRPIIVEGFDNSGKTTLIEKLSQTFGIPIVLSCRSIPLKDQLEWIQRQVENHESTLYDRFTLISEHVYGPILRDGSKFDSMDEPWGCLVDRVLESMNPIIIYCRPSTGTIIRNYHEREQLEGTSDNLERLINRYDWIMQFFPHITYDWQFDIYGTHMINKICRIDPYYNATLKYKYDKLYGYSK